MSGTAARLETRTQEFTLPASVKPVYVNGVASPWSGWGDGGLVALQFSLQASLCLTPVVSFSGPPKVPQAVMRGESKSRMECSAAKGVWGILLWFPLHL